MENKLLLFVNDSFIMHISLSQIVRMYEFELCRDWGLRYVWVKNKNVRGRG